MRFEYEMGRKDIILAHSSFSRETKLDKTDFEITFAGGRWTVDGGRWMVDGGR